MKKALLLIHNFFERYGLLLSLLTAVVFAVLYSCLSVERHMHFQSGAFDLGIFDQALWQYSHFLYPFSTIKEKLILGDHLNLMQPFLVPLYWLWDDVRILLTFQAVWVSLSSVGIYLFFRKRLFSAFQSLLISVTYLLFYGIQFGLYFDFHPILLITGLMAWILYFWEGGYWKLFWISIVVMLLSQENSGVALLGLCCIWFFQGKRRKLVVVLGVLGIVSTAVSFFLIHLFSQGHLQYVPQLSHTPQGIVSSFFDAPEKREVWWYTYVSYAFLPLFSIGSVLAVVGDLSQYFITGKGFDHMWSPFLHHRAILSIFLLAGLSDVLVFVRAHKKMVITPLVVLLFFWSLLVTYHYHFALTKLFHSSYWQQEQWMADNNEVIAHIPPTASLAAQQSLVPHVTHREKIYLIFPRPHDFAKDSPCGVKSCWWLDFDGKPDYLFVDTHPGEWATMTLENIDNFTQAVHNMEKEGVITPVYRQGEARLYKVNEERLKSLW